MQRRSRRAGGGLRSRKPNRSVFGKKLLVEQLESRLVLTQLLGTDIGATLPSEARLSATPVFPFLELSRPEESPAATAPLVWTNPRQLPGTDLQLLPPSDLYSIDPAIVAGDPNGTPPDSPSNRVDANTADSLFAGVGSLRVQVGSSNYVCTATAISPIHVLTAAHCLDTNANGTIDTTPGGVTFNVNMSGSSSTYQISANQLYLHPDWTGFNNPSVNDDVAIVELSSVLPGDVPIYALNEVPFDEPVSAHFVGYGRSGDGISGYTTGASYTVKRWGMNDIDFYFTDDEGSDAREIFQFDFDYPSSSESLGNDVETTLGGGDSGGPSFIEDANGDLLVFGVNTFTTRFSSTSPVAPLFGSGGGGMVVSEYLEFINDILYGDQVIITESDGSTAVAEGGATDSYSVVLTKLPSHSVVIDISGGSQLSVSPSQLTFTTSNWNVPQNVVVGAVDDTLADGPHIGRIQQTVTSADLNYDRATIANIVARITDNDWSLATTPYVDLGTSDNVARDQPQVAVELLEDAEGLRSVGPSVFDTWLLDTGANTTIAFAWAVNDMLEPPYEYATEGKFIEYGVAGSHEFDISAAYRFDFTGNDGQRNTLLNERILSDPLNNIGIIGPFGIVGMPAMEGRVTTFDFTPWTVVDIFGDLLMRVEFDDEVPAGDGNRFSVPVDTRMTFSPDEQVVEGDYPPMWGDVPFMTMIPVHNGVAAGGDFIYDSGAQVSVMSSRLAKEIGLDSNSDGVLDELDANFTRYETVGGIGGTIDAPVFLFDEVRVPTQQGVDLAWTDLEWLVLDIADGLDGVCGFDLMTSGWIEAFAVDGQSGYIMETQLDFREMGTEGTGVMHFDLNPEVNQVIDPTGPGAKIVPTGGSTTVSEIGIDDTYQIALTQQPAANVTITLDVDMGTAADQLIAVDAANPSHHYLEFTPANWDVPQTVLVSAIDDNTIEIFHRSSVRHDSASADPEYQGVGMPRVTVNIIDDDYAGVMIIPSNGATEVVEGGSQDTYQMVLTYQPALNVTIRLDHAQGQVTATSAANPQDTFLTFTPANWYVAQSVLVTAVDDNVDEGTHETYISHIIDTNDPDYEEAFVLQELVVVHDRKLNVDVNGTTTAYLIEGFSAEDAITTELRITDEGSTLELAGNTWKKLAVTYEVTAATVLEFDFDSSRQGEIHGIGFDTDEVPSPSQMFQLYGTQSWGMQDYHDYNPAGGTQHYLIPVGQFFTGTMTRLVLATDDDASALGQSLFSNIRIYEAEFLPIVLDSEDTQGVTLVGSWTDSTTIPGYQGLAYKHDGNTGKGSKSVVFTPEIPVAGQYEVYLWWTEYAGRATNVPVDINHSGGTETVTVNQQANGSQWNLLGTFQFDAGTEANVVIRTTGTNGFVIADAVRFVRTADTSAPSADLSDPVHNATISGAVLNARGYLDVTFSDEGGSGLDRASITDEGHEFALGGSASAGVAVAGAATLVAGTESTYRYVFSGAFGDGPVTVGFAAGSWRDNSGNVNVAETEVFSVGDLIVLDSEGTQGVTLVGSWTDSTTVPGYQGLAYKHDGNTAKGSKSVAFTPEVPVAGIYEVYLWWTQHTGRATNVPVDITYSGGTETVTVNQQANGSQWNLLGAFQFNAGTAGNVVIRTDGTNGFVIADAVRFVRLADTLAPAADLSDPANGTMVSGADLNARGYFEVTFTDEGGSGLEASSITDVGTEFALMGDASAGVTVNGIAALVAGTESTYRYVFTGAFGQGDVTVAFSAGSWQDAAGNLNVAEVETFSLSDPIDLDSEDSQGVTLVGSWYDSTTIPGYQGLAYKHDGNTGKGTKSVTFTPDVPVAGIYEVYLWWTEHTGRATNVPVDIHYSGGSETVTVNQRASGSQWNLLGTFQFDAGTAGNVVVRTDGTNGFVIADAVRWVRTTDTTAPSADLSDPGSDTTISGALLNARGYLDVTFADAGGSGLDAASITDIETEFVLSGPASAGVTVNGAAALVAGSESTYRYSFTGTFGEGDVTVEFGAGSWQDHAANVNLAESETFSVSDRIEMDSESILGVALLGGWYDSTTVPGYQGLAYKQDGNTGKGTKSVTFAPDIPIVGTYEVYLWWTEHIGRATNVPVDINYTGGTETVTVNQQTSGSQWNLLGTFEFETGTAGNVVLRTDGTNGVVIVDAIRFVRL